MNTQASSGPGSHLTLRTHREKLPAGRLTPHKVWRTHSAALFPPLARGTAAHWSLQMDEGRRTGLVGRTHIGALYWTSFSTYLWHSPPSSPFHFPPVHTYAFEAPSPGVASFFFLPIFPVCSVISQDQNSSQVNPASPEPGSLLDSIDVQSFTPAREWARSERKSVSQREE